MSIKILQSLYIWAHSVYATVNVIKGALQPVSIPPEETFQSTLGGSAWHPHEVKGKTLTFYGRNPNQKATENLRATAITRTVGGMATHWTCCCRKSSLNMMFSFLIPRLQPGLMKTKKGKRARSSSQKMSSTSYLNARAIYSRSMSMNSTILSVIKSSRRP